MRAMKTYLLGTLALAAGLASAVVAAPAHAKSREGVTLEDEVDVAGKHLLLNGLGVREATVFNVKVYVAGLYLEQKSADASAILAADQVKRLVMSFKRDVDADDLTEAFHDGFEKVLGEAGMKAMGAKIGKLDAALRDVKEGQKIIISYVPGTGTTIEVGGKAGGTIPGLDFAQALLGIFIGPTPPNAGLKAGLLGKG